MLLSVIAGLPAGARAIGLGEPVVTSHLGERLQVRIALFLDAGENADDVKVRLAPESDRERFGNSPQGSDVQMRLAVVESGNNAPFISVTSAGSVREPALSFVIEARTSATRFMREYTVLLDPVNYAPTRQAPATGRSASSPVSPRLPQPPPARAPAAAPGGALAGDTYGPVAPGETLSELGARLRPDDGVSVSQMTVALFQANPQAFADNDINRLIAGAHLRVPQRREATAVSARSARARLYGRDAPPAAAQRTPPEPAVRPAGQAASTARTASTRDAAAVTDPAPPGPSDEATTDPDSAGEERAEDQFRLTLLPGDPSSQAQVAGAIARLADSDDREVRGLIDRLGNAHREGEEYLARNRALRARINDADARITELMARLRDSNQQIRALEVAIRAEPITPPARINDTGTDAGADRPQPDPPEGRSSFWQWVAHLASQVPPLAWIALAVALWGVWLLVRRARRRRDGDLEDAIGR